MKIDISNLFCTTLPISVCLSPLHSSPSHSCTRATCTSVSQWPVKTGSHSDSLAFVCVVCHKSEESADCVTVFFLPAPGAVRKYDRDQHTNVLSGTTQRSSFVQKKTTWQQYTIVKGGCSHNIVSAGRGGS